MEDPIKAEFESLLKSLPILGIVAFAARTARRVEPLYAAAEDSDAGGVEMVAEAIATAEKTAGGAEISFETASQTARKVAGASRAVTDAAALAAKSAAGAAGTGAIVAGNNPEASTHAVRAAANAARDAIRAAADDRCREAMLADIRRLAELDGNATDGAVVPESFFEIPLWPDGEPAWVSGGAVEPAV